MALPSGWGDEVLDYWFGELTPKHWFKAEDQAALDAEVRHRFGGLLEEVAAADTGELAMLPAHGLLAAILVLDQFPRNIHRGTPGAFATDPQALELARAAVADGRDRETSPDRRLFIYLPFEHSERLEDQDTSVALISMLGDAELTRYAERHREIIARFGRFPHRNAILGRPPMPEEIVFLNEPESAF